MHSPLSRFLALQSSAQLLPPATTNAETNHVLALKSISPVYFNGLKIYFSLNCFPFSEKLLWEGLSIFRRASPPPHPLPPYSRGQRLQRSEFSWCLLWDTVVHSACTISTDGGTSKHHTFHCGAVWFTGVWAAVIVLSKSFILQHYSGAVNSTKTY